MKRSIQPEGAFGLRKSDICIPQDRLQGVKIGLLQKNFCNSPRGGMEKGKNLLSFVGAMKIAAAPDFGECPSEWNAPTARSYAGHFALHLCAP